MSSRLEAGPGTLPLPRLVALKRSPGHEGPPGVPEGTPGYMPALCSTGAWAEHSCERMLQDKDPCLPRTPTHWTGLLSQTRPASSLLSFPTTNTASASPGTHSPSSPREQLGLCTKGLVWSRLHSEGHGQQVEGGAHSGRKCSREMPSDTHFLGGSSLPTKGSLSSGVKSNVSRELKCCVL